MHRPVKLVSLGAVLALAITALGATATLGANESRVTFVNGIAGKAIDICLNGKEAKSGLKYGAVTSRVRDNGTYKLKVFKKDARKCKGTLLGQTTLELSYDDLTVVATKRYPKIVVFDDTGLTTSPPNGYVAFRNASDLGPVSFKYMIASPILPFPAADPVWAKGQQAYFSGSSSTPWGLMATRPDQTKILAGPKFQTVATGRRHEWVLVGHKGKNAKMVTFSRSFWSTPM